MSIAVDFVWDSRDLAVWRNRVVDSALARAVRLAGNQALRVQQKESVKTVTSRKHLKPKAVQDGLPLDFPGRGQKIEDLEWTEHVSSKPVPLSRFPHIQTKRGVSVRINKRGSTKRIRGAFVANMASGHRGVFVRKGKARLPIKELWTSRLSDTMQDRGVIPAVQGKAMKKFQSAFERGLKREIEKLQSRGMV
mgnify:CR=1 FL=1